MMGVLVCLAVFQAPTAARTPSLAMLQAQALVVEVNSRRAANGLPAYNISSALMASAQAHSDYQASVGMVTHTGAGGTRPMDRAMAAGYGGGNQVFVTENIYGGMNTSASQAVDWWIADGGWHYEGVMSTTYQDIGAGVASSGGTTYYTLDAGWISGNAAAPSTTGNGAANNVPAANATKAVVVKPLMLATAAADGSIVHTVEQGQTLWTLAAKYKISLDELLALNKLNQNSFVFPGDKIVVRPSNTPGAAVPSEAASPAASLAVTLPADAPPPGTETPTPIAALDMLSTPVALTAVPSVSTENAGFFSWRGIAALFIGIVALSAVLVLSFIRKDDEN